MEASGGTGKADEPEKDEDLPEQPERKEADHRSDARKLLIAQVITLLATPLSVAITVYMTDKIKEAKPELEYVGTAEYVFSAKPEPTDRELIVTAKRLSPMFREALQQPPPNIEYPIACTKWLDDDSDWDADCLDILRSTALKLKGNVEGALNNMEVAANTNFPLRPPAKTLENAREDIKRLDTIVGRLEVVKKIPASRSGTVEIEVGVLNSGSSDGTIPSRAEVKFSGGTFHVYATSSKENPAGYVVVKAHTFIAAKFKTARESDGDISGTYTVGEEAIIKKWSSLIRSGEEVPFGISIALSKRLASITGSVPKADAGK
jgi:hypothetical protein